MKQRASRSWITAGVVIVGAGIITATPTTLPLPEIRMPDIQLTSGAQEMVLDLVRHGQSTDNVAGIIGTTPPGAPLTDLGEQQAHNVAQSLQKEFPHGVDGIYESDFLRTHETAAPYAALEHMPVTDLSGLNEVNAGIFNDLPEKVGGIPYALPLLAWEMGLLFVPMPGSASNPNGMAFEERFNDAVQSIYNAGGTPIDGQQIDVAFSHGGAISLWTMMNVKNPDLALTYKDVLPNTGQVVVEGNPTDGWTLVSWDGKDVPQTPGPGTELFVDVRNLIMAPQMALWNLWQTIVGDDPTAASNAVQTSAEEVGSALLQVP